MMDFTEVIALAAGICTGMSPVPQLYKIIKTMKAENISYYFMLAILITGLPGWMGLVRHTEK